jgi:serine/threonine protein kinase
MDWKQLGRYEILERIGQGQLSTVYAANDIQLHRKVAIKIFLPEISKNNVLRTALLRETELISSLEHSAIVPIYDFGEYQGHIFVVMRHMSGGNLKYCLRSGSFSALESNEILQRVASALDFAHRRRIVHGEIKPTNVLLDQQGNAFLTDFGFLRLALSQNLQVPTLNLRDLAYFAPEIRLQPSLSTVPSDIYSLGILLFELLTGLLPEETLRLAGQSVQPQFGNIPNIRSVRPDLPVGSETIIHRATDTDITNRYATAGAMAAAFGSVVEAAVLRGRGSVSNLLYPRPSATGTLPVAAASGAGRNPTTYVGVELLPIIENATGAPRLEPTPKNMVNPVVRKTFATVLLAFIMLGLVGSLIGFSYREILLRQNAAVAVTQVGDATSALTSYLTSKTATTANVLGVTAQASISFTASPSVGDFPTNTLLPKSTETLGSISTGLTATPAGHHCQHAYVDRYSTDFSEQFDRDTHPYGRFYNPCEC